MFKVSSIQYIYRRIHTDPASSQSQSISHLITSPWIYTIDFWLMLLFQNLQFCRADCSLTCSSGSSAALCSPCVWLSGLLELWSLLLNHTPQLGGLWTCPSGSCGPRGAWLLNPEMRPGSWASAPRRGCAPSRWGGAALSWCRAPLCAPCPSWPHKGSEPGLGWRRKKLAGSGERSKGKIRFLPLKGGSPDAEQSLRCHSQSAQPFCCRPEEAWSAGSSWCFVDSCSGATVQGWAEGSAATPPCWRHSERATTNEMQEIRKGQTNKKKEGSICVYSYVIFYQHLEDNTLQLSLCIWKPIGLFLCWPR